MDELREEFVSWLVLFWSAVGTTLVGISVCHKQPKKRPPEPVQKTPFPELPEQSHPRVQMITVQTTSVDASELQSHKKDNDKSFEALSYVSNSERHVGKAKNKNTSTKRESDNPVRSYVTQTLPNFQDGEIPDGLEMKAEGGKVLYIKNGKVIHEEVAGEEKSQSNALSAIPVQE